MSLIKVIGLFDPPTTIAGRWARISWSGDWNGYDMMTGDPPMADLVDGCPAHRLSGEDRRQTAILG